MDPDRPVNELQRVLLAEAEGIRALADAVDDSWLRALELIRSCRGRLVLIGLGKSGHIGRKLAATFASLGQPAIFVHATEAAHGDLGMITAEDVVMAISNSGETAEVVGLLPFLRKIGVPVIAVTGRPDSTLARGATCVLTLPPVPEADPLGVAPTTSSAMTLAAGDALAVTLAQLRGFRREDFAFRHPGGSLGQALKETIQGSER